jgi:hypothetical protein
MSNAQDLDRETIHRRARDYAEMRTILEIATSQELAQDAEAIVDLFFQAYDEFAARISGQQFEQPRLVSAETIPIVQKLALQATIARFSGRDHTLSDESLLGRLEAYFGGPVGPEARLFLHRIANQLQEAFSAQNRQE